MDMPASRLSATVIGSPDPRALAGFYQRLLGWHVTDSEDPEPGRPARDVWVTIRSEMGVPGLSFQYEPDHTRPVWPQGPGAQQMQMHLDIAVADLEDAATAAEELGATVAPHQPQDDVRVMLDPDGHPFCLFVDTV
jgi:predicted enzyme related to lactoylglutathione lyase